jgi:hypothetical protein
MHRGEGWGEARASCASPLGTPLVQVVCVVFFPPGVHIVADVLSGDLHKLAINVQAHDPGGVIFPPKSDRHVA